MTSPAESRQSGLLVKIETDRRLGHEWDEWDGTPLPNGGDFRSGPARYFAFTAAGILVAAAFVATLVFLLAPRLALIARWLPRSLYLAIAAMVLLAAAWLILVGLSYVLGRSLLPAWLAERGLVPRLFPMASKMGRVLGVQRDWTEASCVEVYERLALARTRSVAAEELLILIPRCLSRASLDGVLDIAKRYNVATYVATRGQLARRAIRERRPRAVVAVACERDLVSGLHDVAAKIPVLGLTMQLPSGPCKDAGLDLVKMEDFVRRMVKPAGVPAGLTIAHSPTAPAR